MTRQEENIRAALGEKWAPIGVRALAETDSTNLRLKEAARAGEIAPPFLLTADSQTAGRGRLSRRFLSPPGTGLYMSLFFQPPTDAESGRVTLLAAVAVCRAVEEAAGLRPKIKWVNDLFLNGKKVCGILAERIDQGVIVGIGVNILTPPGGFPPEAGPAGALNVALDRDALAGAIARHFLDGAENLRSPAILEAYRQRMPLVGRQIFYTSPDGLRRSALVTGVAEDGGLEIVDGDEKKVLRTGEVTLGSQAFDGLL